MCGRRFYMKLKRDLVTRRCMFVKYIRCVCLLNHWIGKIVGSGEVTAACVVLKYCVGYNSFLKLVSSGIKTTALRASSQFTNFFTVDQNVTHSWRHQRRSPSPKLNFFHFKIRLHEPLQGLNSSLAQSAAELWLAKFGLKWQIIPFMKLFDFCKKQGFWAIILVPDMIESQARALKTRIWA